MTSVLSAWPLHPTWADIVVRLLSTVVASALLGFNRGSHGHATGIRTTTLVGVAAALAMIQANILLSSSGKAPDSFGTLDLMRMPLGILTGVGFIGGGVILKRGATVKGVTTAATLWIVTAVSLCFGGGQFGLGACGTLMALIALYLLKAIDVRIPRRQRGLLEIVNTEGVEPPDLDAIVGQLGCRARYLKQAVEDGPARNRVWFEIEWTDANVGPPSLRFLTAVAARYPVAAFTMQSESDD